MQSIEDLIDPLIEATQKGQLVWEVSGSLFETELDPFTVRTWTGINDNDDSSFVSVALFDNRGEMLDNTAADEYEASYPRLRLLHTTARRSAHNVDVVIDDLMKRLKGLSDSDK